MNLNLMFLMNPWLLIIACALAVFRLSELVTVDDGPFNIFFELRSWANDTRMDGGLKRNFSNILTCVHCSGMYIALILILGLIFFHKVFLVLVYWQAVAGLASILATRFGRAG